MMVILKKFTNMVFPVTCKQCGNPISADAQTAYFCKNCWDGINWFEGPCCTCCGLPYPAIDSSVQSKIGADGHLCGTCSKTPPAFDKAISAGPYEGTLAEAIKLFKYKKRIHIGRALTNQVMTSPIVGSVILTDSGDDDFISIPANSCGRKSCYIIPVPLHIKRLREREFNQSAVIALAFGARFDLPVLTDVLIRLRHTRPQVELGMKERRDNVAGVFTVQNREMIKGKDLILIDDVYTTGSTVNECAKVLKKNGARMVYVVTIARMVK